MPANILKYLGIAEVAGKLIGSLFNIEFLNHLDILRGYKGDFPTYVALVLSALGYIFVYFLPRALLRTTWKKRLSLVMLVSFLITLLLVLIPIPQTATGLGEARWFAAMLFFWIFYFALGGVLV